MPLRDKAGSSENSISKTPTTYRWGQTLPVYCAAHSKPPPLAKGRLVFDRAIQSDFSTALEMTRLFFDLILAQNCGFCAKEERQRREVARRVYAACLERSLPRRARGEISERQRRTKGEPICRRLRRRCCIRYKNNKYYKYSNLLSNILPECPSYG